MSRFSSACSCQRRVKACGAPMPCQLSSRFGLSATELIELGSTGSTHFHPQWGRCTPACKGLRRRSAFRNWYQQQIGWGRWDGVGQRGAAHGFGPNDVVCGNDGPSNGTVDIRPRGVLAADRGHDGTAFGSRLEGTCRCVGDEQHDCSSRDEIARWRDHFAAVIIRNHVRLSTGHTSTGR